jgi:enoyl-CoA hydratase/carnithine racemase
LSEEARAAGKLLLRREGGVATLTLNHPEKLNSLELEMWGELARVMPELDGDPSVRVLVFRGAGERAFSAGADISRFAEERSDSKQGRAYAERFFAGLDAVDAFSKPSLCLIRGACVGGGVELAAAADLRFAGEGSRFGVPVAKLGLVAGYAELRRFVQSIGPARTLDMLLTARLFTAREMLEAGFLARVVPDEEVEKATYEAAERIASLAPLVHAWHKRFVKKILRDPALSTLTEEEFASQFACFDTGDFREGVAAFLAKRAPKFEGR